MIDDDHFIHDSVSLAPPSDNLAHDDHFSFQEYPPTSPLPLPLPAAHSINDLYFSNHQQQLRHSPPNDLYQQLDSKQDARFTESEAIHYPTLDHLQSSGVLLFMKANSSLTTTTIASNDLPNKITYDSRSTPEQERNQMASDQHDHSHSEFNYCMNDRISPEGSSEAHQLLSQPQQQLQSQSSSSSSSSNIQYNPNYFYPPVYPTGSATDFDFGNYNINATELFPTSAFSSSSPSSYYNHPITSPCAYPAAASSIITHQELKVDQNIEHTFTSEEPCYDDSVSAAVKTQGNQLDDYKKYYSQPIYEYYPPTTIGGQEQKNDQQPQISANLLSSEMNDNEPTIHQQSQFAQQPSSHQYYAGSYYPTSMQRKVDGSSSMISRDPPRSIQFDYDMMYGNSEQPSLYREQEEIYCDPSYYHTVQQQVVHYSAEGQRKGQPVISSAAAAGRGLSGSFAAPVKNVNRKRQNRIIEEEDSDDNNEEGNEESSDVLGGCGTGNKMSENSSKRSRNQEVRKRKRKNNDQLKVLKVEYSKGGFWGKEKIQEMSQITGLSESQVYKWCWDQKKKRLETFKKKLGGRMMMSGEGFQMEDFMMSGEDDEESFGCGRQGYSPPQQQMQQLHPQSDKYLKMNDENAFGINIKANISKLSNDFTITQLQEKVIAINKPTAAAVSTVVAAVTMTKPLQNITDKLLCKQNIGKGVESAEQVKVQQVAVLTHPMLAGHLKNKRNADFCEDIIRFQHNSGQTKR